MAWKRKTLKIDLFGKNADKQIKEAVKKVNEYKNSLSEVNELFLKKCAEKIIELANGYLDQIPIDTSTKALIKQGWEYSVQGDTVTIRNTDESNSAVLEFGVGLKGWMFPHPASGDAGYQYNIPTEHKDSRGQWAFYLKQGENLDLKKDNISETWVDKQDGTLTIFTYGQEAQLFTYNALLDFEEQGLADWLYREAVNELLT